MIVRRTGELIKSVKLAKVNSKQKIYFDFQVLLYYHVCLKLYEKKKYEFNSVQNISWFVYVYYNSVTLNFF